jgi:Na+-translocating ferredoxin:NAD+ oxidoreductase RnfC subunit
MDRNITNDIRRILASNFDTMLAHACRCHNFPRQIKVQAFQRHADRSISQANFAFQIDAIDANTYCYLRNCANNVTDAITKLRKIYNAKNFMCGQAQAIAAAKASLISAITDLRVNLHTMKQDSVTTTTA